MKFQIAFRLILLYDMLIQGFLLVYNYIALTLAIVKDKYTNPQNCTIRP